MFRYAGVSCVHPPGCRGHVCRDEKLILAHFPEVRVGSVAPPRNLCLRAPTASGACGPIPALYRFRPLLAQAAGFFRPSGPFSQPCVQSTPTGHVSREPARPISLCQQLHLVGLQPAFWRRPRSTLHCSALHVLRRGVSTPP